MKFRCVPILLVQLLSILTFCGMEWVLEGAVTSLRQIPLPRMIKQHYFDVHLASSFFRYCTRAMCASIHVLSRFWASAFPPTMVGTRFYTLFIFQFRIAQTGKKGITSPLFVTFCWNSFLSETTWFKFFDVLLHKVMTAAENIQQGYGSIVRMTGIEYTSRTTRLKVVR